MTGRVAFVRRQKVSHGHQNACYWLKLEHKDAAVWRLRAHNGEETLPYAKRPFTSLPRQPFRASGSSPGRSSASPERLSAPPAALPRLSRPPSAPPASLPRLWPSKDAPSRGLFRNYRSRRPDSAVKAQLSIAQIMPLLGNRSNSPLLSALFKSRPMRKR